MKKSSVLNRRAALFAAIVVMTTVAVGLSAFALIEHGRITSAVRGQLLPQARVLADSAAGYAATDSARGMDEVKLFALSGGTVWLTGTDRNVVNLTDAELYPQSLTALENDVFDGAEKVGKLRLSEGRCAYAMVPVRRGSGVVGVLSVAQPIKGLAGHWMSALLSALIGLFVGVALGSWALPKLMHPVLRPIAQLRDVAVAIADGDLSAKADETGGDEVGQLGQAVNNLSHQLSRNMYTLIIERNRLKNMLNGLSEGIVAIDREGEVTHTNPALEKFFQKRSGVYLPDPRMKWIPDESVWQDFDAVIRTGEAMTRTMECRDMVLRIVITPIVDEIGAIAGAVGLFSDITQMERLERTRREYVSNVSHELRTPLTAMRALIEPLKEGMVTEEADRMRYYDIILREIMRLSRLINDQLELSRLQSGTLSIEKEVMRLDELVYEVCDRNHSIAVEKGLEVRIATDFSACPEVYANADRVEQLLVILLDNAIKYTETGSVTVSATWDDERVVLHVADTGIGIEENDLPYVFDRFYKVDKAHSGKGSGLGLSIAKELLKQMGEEIWVTSEKGKGTEFSFTVHRPTEADIQAE